MLKTLRSLALTALCLTVLAAAPVHAADGSGDVYQLEPIAFTLRVPPGFSFVRGAAVMTLAYDQAVAPSAQTVRVEKTECALQGTSSEDLLKVDVAAGELPVRPESAEKPRQAGLVVALEFQAGESGPRYVVELKYFDSMRRKETLREATASGLAKRVAAKYDGLVLPLESLESGGELQAVRPQGGEPVELYSRAGSLDDVR